MKALSRILFHTSWLTLFLAAGLSMAEDAPAPATASTNKPAASKRKPSVASRLVFDEDTKYYNAKLTDTNAVFKFQLTNTWTEEVTIDRIETSCGCTLGTLPSNPWHMAAGTNGIVGATVNLEGKGSGLMTKTLTLYLSTNGTFIGTRVATVKITIPAPPAPESLSEADRKAAMMQAKADPQKIFKDPQCAKCHVDQGRIVSTGDKIYAADCGICHDSPNRDSAVPDLHALKHPTNSEYWMTMVTFGKTNTMMPAFSAKYGGPLNEYQIHTLVEYLASSEFAHATAKPAVSAEK